MLGAGMAGIAAAVQLAGRGLRPVLLESRPYCGGRVRSFVHGPTGDVIDNGQHLLMGCYHDTMRLLRTLGTDSLVQMQSQLEVQFRDADGTPDALRAAGALPAPLNVAAGLLRLKRLSLRQRLGLLRLGLRLRGKSGGALSGESVEDYLLRHGQHETVRRRLWHPIVIATLNTPPHQASAYLFTQVMRRAFLGSARADSQLAYATAGLSRLTAPAAEYITARGGEVITGAGVTGITRSGDSFIINIKEAPPVLASQIISCVPPHALAGLTAEDPALHAITQDFPQRFTYSPIVSLYLWYDRPLPAVPAFAALLGTNVQWMFNRRRLCADTNAQYPGLLSCTISAAFDQSKLSTEDMAAMADAELRRAFPETGGARLLCAQVIKEKQATYMATPQAEPLRPGPRTAVPGFLLAGDWTATGLPATIEGAVYSGFRAAAEVRAEDVQ